METCLELARGPLFVFSLAFMLLGLLRHVVLTTVESVGTVRRAGDKAIPYRRVLAATAKWLFPLQKVRREPVFSATSIFFHVAILVVPLFLAGHVALISRSLGIAWPAVPNVVADVLTITAVITAVALVIQRLSARLTRALSRIQDYLLPLVVALPFATGFLAMHPIFNPFPYEATLLMHVMSGNLVLVLMPITKLSHAVMLPSVQLVSELGWHWPADAGSRVGVALGKEGDPV